MIKKIRFMVIGLISFLLVLSLGLSVAGVSIEFSGLSEGKVIAGMQTMKLDIKVSGSEKVKNVKVYLGDEVIYQTEYAPYQFFWITTELNDGIYTLRAVVETNSGTEEAVRTVRVQNHLTPSGETIYSWDFEEQPEGWGAGRDLEVELVKGSAFQGDYAAKYSGTYIYTTICRNDTKWGTYSSLGYPEIYSNKKYYMEAWVKIDKINSEDFSLQDIGIKLNAMVRDENGKVIHKLYSQMAYDFSKLGSWQKLWFEFDSKPEVKNFYLRLDTTGQDVVNAEKTIDIELYLDDVKIIEI